MPDLLLRSPQYSTYIQGTLGGTTIKSSKLNITIQGVLRYPLIKDAADGVSSTYEWAELARDYLNITYNGTPTTLPAFPIILDFTFHSLPNAGGSVVHTFQESHFGFDGYGTFLQSTNPTMYPPQFPLISNYTQAGSSDSGLKTYTVYATKNVEFYIPSIVSGEVIYTSTGYNGTSVSIGTYTVNIIRRECTKYTGNDGYTELNGIKRGFQVNFINKYGAIQTEFFTLKAVRSLKVKRETYNRNILQSNGALQTFLHTKQNYNITATQSITLNSFYVPEYYSMVYSEMLLSESIWVRYRDKTTGNFETIPINIKDNSMSYKNSLNDRLIQFTFNFETSFDYINNVR